MLNSDWSLFLGCADGSAHLQRDDVNSSAARPLGKHHLLQLEEAGRGHQPGAHQGHRAIGQQRPGPWPTPGTAQGIWASCGFPGPYLRPSGLTSGVCPAFLGSPALELGLQAWAGGHLSLPPVASPQMTLTAWGAVRPRPPASAQGNWVSPHHSPAVRPALGACPSPATEEQKFSA